MAFWTARILLTAAAVLFLFTDDSLAQLKGNICGTYEHMHIALLYTQCRSRHVVPLRHQLAQAAILSNCTLELWETTKAMFGGKPPAQAVLSMCSASPGAGETLIAEFTNQQTKADKPKFKKALKDCSS
ncbi:hypothetical protein MRX96_016028 [Rhipicephalus microplus]